MIYGLRNTVTGQVEQTFEGKKADFRRLADKLSGQTEHLGEPVTFEVVKIDDDGIPAEE